MAKKSDLKPGDSAPASGQYQQIGPRGRKRSRGYVREGQDTATHDHTWLHLQAGRSFEEQVRPKPLTFARTSCRFQEQGFPETRRKVHCRKRSGSERHRRARGRSGHGVERVAAPHHHGKPSRRTGSAGRGPSEARSGARCASATGGGPRTGCGESCDLAARRGLLPHPDGAARELARIEEEEAADAADAADLADAIGKAKTGRALAKAGPPGRRARRPSAPTRAGRTTPRTALRIPGPSAERCMWLRSRLAALDFEVAHLLDAMNKESVWKKTIRSWLGRLRARRPVPT